jgi:uncharacterized membrane protein YgcG
MKKHLLPRRTILLFTVLLALCAGPFLASGQGFTIERFQVDLYLHRDGSFEVREQIHTNFTESKHGIRRLLPYRYEAQEVEGEIAMNHLPGFSYTTPLDSVRVEGHEYVVARESDYYNIRIGSGDSYVSGRVAYNISYQVYGAINRFYSGDELYWNVNGNGWDVPTESVDITVHLPDGKVIDQKDLRLYTGFKGAKESDATATTAPGTITARTTRALKPYEGLTILFRLPKNYLQHADPPLRVLADDFIAHDLRTEVDLQTDGTALVTETFDLDVKNQTIYVERRLGTSFPYSWLTDHLQHQSGNLMVELLSVDHLAENGVLPQPIRQSSSPGYESLRLGNNVSPGRQGYRVRYRVWNAMEFSLGEGRFYFPWLNYNLGEPIEKATLVVRWPKGMNLVRERCQIVLSIQDRLDQQLGTDSLVLTSNGTLFKDFTASAALVLHGQWHPAKLPMRLFSPDEYIQWHEANVEIHEDGSVRFDHHLGLINNSYQKLFPVLVRDRYVSWFSDNAYTSPAPQLFGYDGYYWRYQEDFSQTSDQFQDYRGTELRFDAPQAVLDGGKAQEISWNYSLYGVIGKDSLGRPFFNFPIVESNDFASDSVTFRIRLPGDMVLDSSLVRAFTNVEDQVARRPIELKFSPGLVEGTVDPGLYSGERVILDLRLPEGAVGHNSGLFLRMTARNHPMLVFPLFVFAFLLILWFIFGRDKTLTRVVRYYPPDDMTPTEAGLLIDDKLHNRDLLALIYYWGARGNLRISETTTAKGKADYTLTKLKDLPSNARKYEKTMFEALFLGRKSIRVSKLKNQYFIYMRMARAQVNAWVSKNKFFVPGTRGFGQILRFFGIVLGVIAFLMGAYTLVFVNPLSNGNWGPVIGWGLSGALMWFFGKIMPRHGAYGLKKYTELRGFMDFIKTAEKDRLRLLLDEDPAYFGLTLSYAIALGMANDWVAKFGPLLTSPPSYYQSGSDTQFNSVLFNQMLTRQLFEMSRNFNSAPAPSGGGSSSYSGSSSSSSWSSSSYSSSGSSGSSGFSGGGGSSGGGYGGGGGSSW